MNKSLNEKIYYVVGMHCSSCEILIEKKLLETDGVKSVEAKAGSGEVVIEYEGQKPSNEFLNKIFYKDGYKFSDQPKTGNNTDKKDWGFVAIAGGAVILLFLVLNKLGVSSFVNVDSQSSLPLFFVFGLLAGVSSCAALVGGMVLSLSKQWNEAYSNQTSSLGKASPHLLFNIGRIISFGIFGGILGFLGKSMGISFAFTSFLVLAVSVLMFLMGMQMIGIKYFQRFQLTTPKFVTRYIANERNFQGRYMPFLMGALTFLLPCGFTITTQGLALLSGSAIRGSLIMLAFVLGTTPVLLGIGFSSIKFSQNPHWASRFTKVAGILVLFFALFNLNSQLNVLGISSLSDLKLKSNQTKASSQDGLPPIVGGKQVIKMNASASGYVPNNFKVRVGIPVRWEISDTGTSGCTNAVISKGLFEGQIALTPGQVSIKEFTPGKPGKYKFSCWMGMISGVIEVVDKSGQRGSTQENVPVSSGASGCGCGGGQTAKSSN